MGSLRRSEVPEAARDRTFPTQSVVQEIIEITTSSSSSLVWNLGIGPLCAAQRRDAAVGPLWGDDRCPVVDMWTTRPLCTGDRDRPRSVPLSPPARPQWMPSLANPSPADGLVTAGVERVCAGQRPVEAFGGCSWC